MTTGPTCCSESTMACRMRLCLLAILITTASAAAARLGAPLPSWHAAGGGGDALLLQPPEAPPEQCFPWSLDSSIAREAFQYPAGQDGSPHNASAGDIIPLQCDSIICPNPQVDNCYMNDAACAADEWCKLEDQVKFGPWAMGHNGETPNIKDRTCDELRESGFTQLFQLVCGGRGNWGPWLAVRGRCVRYRRLEESCNAYYAGSGADGPQYAVSAATGSPPARALLCAPGLVCTGDVEPVPHTCVKARPPDVCYQGPWWDSTTWCKQQGSGGLSRVELEMAAQALVIQLPVEALDPVDPKFWHSPEAQRARSIIQGILEVLWPEQYSSDTQFPLPFPSPQGEPGSQEWNVTTAEVLRTLHQANKVWSTIHTVIWNTKSPLSRRQIDASRSLAVWLRQHFFCCNCRGFWSADVLNAIGLPPDSSDREAHKRWWWMAHNMASEHSAATRGGHPWIFPALQKDEDFREAFGSYSKAIKCQNPWFLPFAAAEDMWTIRD